MRGLDEGRPAWKKRQPYSDRAIEPRQPRIWPPCGRQTAVHPVTPVDIAEIRVARSRHGVIQVPCRNFPISSISQNRDFGGCRNAHSWRDMDVNDLLLLAQCCHSEWNARVQMPQSATPLLIAQALKCSLAAGLRSIASRNRRTASSLSPSSQAALIDSRDGLFRRAAARCAMSR